MNQKLMKNLPNGWEWKALGEITECLDSKRIPLNSKERELRKGNIPYYGANGQVDYVNDYIFDEELLLLSEDGGSWGRNEKCSYIINGKSWVNNHAHVLRMKSSVMIKFLEVYLNLSDLTAYISGTTRGKLNQRIMNEIKIPLPPISVQKQIVSILERAEKLKETRKQANEETSKLLQSIFLEMFGDIQINSKKWPTGDLLNASSEKPQYGSGAKAVNYDGKIRYIRITDIDENGDLRDNMVSPSDVEEKYFLEKGDLLFARSGATVGKTYLHRSNNRDSIYAGYMIRFRFNLNLCNPIFIYHLTKTKYYTKWVKNTQTQVAQPNINAKQYGKFDIIIPPIELQNQFASIVEKFESLKENQQKSTEDINQLFDVLMHKAFNGELGV